MASLKITNISNGIVNIQELYKALAPGESVETTRFIDELEAHPRIQQLWADGDITVEVVRDAAETGFTAEFLSPEGPWKGNQSSDVVELVDGPTVDIDASASNFFVLTATNLASRQLNNPTGLVRGQTFIVVFEQDATAGRELTFDTYYDFGEDLVPDFTTMLTPGQWATISCVVVSPTRVGVFVKKGFLP